MYIFHIYLSGADTEEGAGPPPLRLKNSSSIALKGEKPSSKREKYLS